MTRAAPLPFFGQIAPKMADKGGGGMAKIFPMRIRRAPNRRLKHPQEEPSPTASHPESIFGNRRV
jgi:hypothetical protein